MSLCFICQKWDIDDLNDRFCSYCGYQLRGIKIYLRGSRLIQRGDNKYGIYLREEADSDSGERLELCVENLGATPFIVSSVTLKGGDWLSIVDAVSDLVISGREPTCISLHVNSGGIFGGLVDICVKSKHEDEGKIEVIPLEYPEWDFGTVKNQINITLDGKDTEETGAWISVSKGSLTINNIEVEGNFATIELLPWGTNFPRNVDSRQNGRLDFRFHFDEHRLKNEYPLGGKLPLKCILDIDGFEKQGNDIEAVLLLPPILDIGELRYLNYFTQKIMEGYVEGIEFHWHNKGGDIVIINQVSLAPAPSWIEVKSPVIFPFELASGLGEVTPLIIEINGQDAPLGTHHIKVCIESNCFEKPSYEFEIRAKVITLEDYPHSVVIDFGTTASTVSFISGDPGAGSEYKMLEFENIYKALPEATPTNMPSAIFYRHKTENGVYIVIGETAYSMYSLGQYPYSAFAGFKKEIDQDELSNKQVVHTGFDKEPYPRKPVDLVTDYLREVISIVEKKVGGKVRKVLATTPATFGSVHHTRMSDAYAKLGIHEVSFLPEPVAAAMDFLVSRDFDEGSFSLMVYDSGGGTTDVTLMKINVTEGQYGVKIIEPEIIGLFGEPRFGGEWVTEEVVFLIREQCRRELEENPGQHGDKTAIDKELVFESDAKMPEEKFLKINVHNKDLLGYANLLKFKLAGSDDWKDEDRIPAKDGPLDLWHFEQGKAVKSGYFPGISPFDLAEIIDYKMMPMIDRLLKIINANMDKLNSDQPDYILLTGRNCRIRRIRENLEAQFPKSKCVFTDETAKSCVVEGAAIFEQFRNSETDVRIKLNKSLNITTVRFGFYRMEGRRGARVFVEVIPIAVSFGEDNIYRKGVRLPEATYRLIIYENRGPSDDISWRENRVVKHNLDIREIDRKEFNFESFNEEDRAKAEISMYLDDTYRIHAVIHVGGKDFPLDDCCKISEKANIHDI